MQLAAMIECNSEMHSERIMERVWGFIWRPRSSNSKILLVAEIHLRSCHGGRGKDKILTLISTGVTISATIHHAPSATCHLPAATRLLVPGSGNSACLWIEHPGAYIEPYSQTRSGVSCLLRVYLGA